MALSRRIIDYFAPFMCVSYGQTGLVRVCVSAGLPPSVWQLALSNYWSSLECIVLVGVSDIAFAYSCVSCGGVSVCERRPSSVCLAGVYRILGVLWGVFCAWVYLRLILLVHVLFPCG